MTKLIVTDLDGTLLRRCKTISDFTADTFAKCRERGIKIVFATARTTLSVAELPATAAIQPDAIIYHNGVIARLQPRSAETALSPNAVMANNKPFRHYPIPYDVAKSLVTQAQEQFPDLRMFVEAGDYTYANYDTEWRIENPRVKFTDLPHDAIDKIIFVAPHDEAQIPPQQVDALLKLLPDSLHHLLVEGGKFMPVTSVLADKSLALAEVAAHFDIDMNDVVAFGDDFNDLRMLQAAGIGVAMGNARDEVKQAANFVTDSHESDGVAKWLAENVL